MMAPVSFVMHDRTADRVVYRLMLDGRCVGTAVELAGDRAAPWRLSLRGCCCNLRRSSRSIVEQTIRRFQAERPAAFLPLPPTGHVAWVPPLPHLDDVAADLRARGVLVVRDSMPQQTEPQQSAAVLLAQHGGV